MAANHSNTRRLILRPGRFPRLHIKRLLFAFPAAHRKTTTREELGGGGENSQSPS